MKYIYQFIIAAAVLCLAAYSTTEAKNEKKAPAFACKDSMAVFFQKNDRSEYMDRIVFLEGPSNVRDLGGLKIKGRKCIKRGLIFRGDNLEQTTDADKATLVEKYGIRTDLDLRGHGTEGSPLGDAVNYVNIAFPWYLEGPDGINGNKHDNIADAVRLFADKKNFPLYYHCAIGRDRTGTITILLMGLCGVPQEEIETDYRTSFYTYSGTRDETPQDFMVEKLYTPLMDYLKSFGGAESLQEGVENFLLDLGLSKKELKAIKKNLTK